MGKKPYIHAHFSSAPSASTLLTLLNALNPTQRRREKRRTQSKCEENFRFLVSQRSIRHAHFSSVPSCFSSAPSASTLLILTLP
jgi:hypothetical protein